MNWSTTYWRLCFLKSKRLMDLWVMNSFRVTKKYLFFYLFMNKFGKLFLLFTPQLSTNATIFCHFLCCLITLWCISTTNPMPLERRSFTGYHQYAIVIVVMKWVHTLPLWMERDAMKWIKSHKMAFWNKIKNFGKKRNFECDNSLRFLMNFWNRIAF